ncbi:MAG: hypothetical protein LBF16_05560 [Pseudomonadales bacterium]|jgi:hypothetical protein|nr:hypothetical protein [Pseudomonadales bacterium]
MKTLPATLSLCGFTVSLLFCTASYGQSAGLYGPLENGTSIEALAGERYTIKLVDSVAGQDAKALASKLNLDGSILRIWESINAIYVSMSKAEAARLSQSSAVVWVEQDSVLTADDQITALPTSAALAGSGQAELSTKGSTGNYVLRVPEVSFSGIPGLYQDAILETINPADPSQWQLMAVEEGFPLRVETVELITTDAMPVQVFLRVKGSIGACSNIGKTAIDITENNFSVFIFHETPMDNTLICVAISGDFTKTIALPVYGLGSGTYTYSVNGKPSGKFILPKNNLLADEDATSKIIFARPAP